MTRPADLGCLFDPPTTTPAPGRDALDALFDPPGDDQDQAHEGNPLDDLFAQMEAEAKTAKAAGKERAQDSAADLLEYLAASGGTAIVSDVLAAGYAPAVLAALARANPDDKRVKPRIALGVIGGHRVAWLRSSGWQAVGQVNRREGAPTETSFRHRLAIPNFARSVASIEPQARAEGLLMVAQYDRDLRTYIETRRQDVRPGGAGRGDPEAAALWGGVYPDALVVENWPPERVAERATYWPTVGGHRTPTGVVRDDGADHITAIEIELSGKANALIAAKVAHHDAAMRLGWWHAVVWATDDRDTQTRLLRAGIADRDTHPGHYLMTTADCGLGPTPADFLQLQGGQPWWVERWNDPSA